MERREEEADAFSGLRGFAAELAPDFMLEERRVSPRPSRLLEGRRVRAGSRRGDASNVALLLSGEAAGPVEEAGRSVLGSCVLEDAGDA